MPITPSNRIAWLQGGSASFAYNFNKYLGLVADFGAYNDTRFSPGPPPAYGVVSSQGGALTYLLGPRLSFRKSDRFTPFVQVLFGATNAGPVGLTGCTSGACVPLVSENTFAMTAGVGLDLKVSHHVAIRLVQAEYLLTRFGDASTNTGVNVTQNNMRLSAGIVFRFGSLGPPPTPAAAVCSAEPAEVFAGEPVSGTATGSNFNPKHSIQYKWSGSGVTVAGSNASTQVDTTGLQPGSYQISANLSDGSKNGLASCMARFDVKRPRPPEIACSSDPGTVRTGGTSTIRSNADSPDNRRLTYSYSASAGNVSGAGATASFDAAGAGAGSITVTCNVSDDRSPALTASATTAVYVEAPPPPPPPPPPPQLAALEKRLALHSIYFQTDRPTRGNSAGGLLVSQEDTLAALAGDFKEYLAIKPEAHLTLEGHADARGAVEYNQTLTDRRVDRAKSFLVEHGVPAANIEVKGFGKERNLSDGEIKEAVEQNPELSPEERQKLLQNMSPIILASNRRVDIVLDSTGQQSTRQYPFNAKDSLSLLSTQGVEKPADNK